MILIFSILSFFFRRESRSLKMEIIKQTYLAANIKEELRELKRNKQHNANLRTQILVHDSFNIVETTPTSSPSSISWDVSSQGKVEKKCNWCQIPFNCFETRKKRLKFEFEDLTPLCWYFLLLFHIGFRMIIGI